MTHPHPIRRPAPMPALALGLVALCAGPTLSVADGFWDRVKEGAGKTVERSGELVKEGAELGAAVGGAVAAKGLDQGKALAADTAAHFARKGTPEEIRARVDTMASETLERLFAEQPEARQLFERGYGYAVFEIRQVSLTVTAGYGYGVAVGANGGERIYMKAATAGVEISKGTGGFAARWVAIFGDQTAFRTFVDEGLDAGAEVGGVAGGQRAGVETRLRKGVTFYRITDGGLNVAATLSGTRFWPDGTLNPPPPPAKVLDLNSPPRPAAPVPATPEPEPADLPAMAEPDPGPTALPDSHRQ